MTIREFVGETILEIQRGVGDAQKVFDGESLGGSVGNLNNKIDGSKVEFDLAVSISSASSADGKLETGRALQIAGVGAGIQGGISSGQTTTNRIRFAVPICYPLDLFRGTAGDPEKTKR